MAKISSYIQTQQRKISRLVTRKFKQYYLTGGTALSFYFNHRFSEDLDFFTQTYRKDDPDKIMHFVAQKTGFEFKLEASQEDPKLIPMKIYFLGLEKRTVLKIDFVQDYQENLKEIKNGMHSIEDIYFRKITAAMGTQQRENVAGKIISTGRQKGKDLFDIYYLSRHHQPLSEFFLEYFSIDKVERFIAWYRSFNRMRLKLELMELVERIDSTEVIRYLDKEILKQLPDKLA